MTIRQHLRGVSLFPSAALKRAVGQGARARGEEVLPDEARSDPAPVASSGMTQGAFGATHVACPGECRRVAGMGVLYSTVA